MKKILTLAMIVLAGLAAEAQPASGKFFVGGDFGLYSTIDKFKSGSTTHITYKQTTFNLMPMAGYFIGDRLSVGVRMGINVTINKNPDATIDKQTTTEFDFRPFGRYYLISGTGGIFAEATIGIGAGTTKYHTDASTTESNLVTFVAAVMPGAYYYITPRLAIEGKFGMLGFTTHMEKNGGDKDISNNFGFDITGSSLSFGLTYTL